VRARATKYVDWGPYGWWKRKWRITAGAVASLDWL